MAKIFEQQKDIDRENRAAEVFCKLYGFNKMKKGRFDLDFDIYNKGVKIAVLEVKGRNRNLSEAYDLPLAERKFNKMMSEDVKKIILWDCLDGMIYGDLEKLSCTSRIGGRKAREGSANDVEEMKYFFRQDNLLEFKY
jgi:hypothetical protein